MKRTRLDFGNGASVEHGPDWNGSYFVCYARGASIFVRDPKDVRRFFRFSPKTPSREKLDEWLASLRPSQPEEPVGDANVAGSFDPLAHDVDNENTKMVI